jgi:chromosomal replication initiator protein
MSFITNEQANKMWSSVLGRLELRIPRPSFNTWLKESKGISCDSQFFYVSVPSAFTANYLKERMIGILETEISDTLNNEISIKFLIEGQLIESNEQVDDDIPLSVSLTNPSFSDVSHVNENSSLNSKYTFENFIVGDSNQLAHSGAKTVSEKIGVVFNPLLFYSDVGLGKTHLLHAIGNVAQKNGFVCFYTTCEEFTNKYIASIQQGTTEKFRDFYRSVDILLLDDIQFLIGKEQTQEGFFHTFNALHMKNSQIVIASDRPISELKVLEPRIVSRFSGGLVADIQSPKLETRIAILKSKAEKIEILIPDSVIEYIAYKIKSNIRELEGCLNRITAWFQFKDEEITLDAVQNILKGPISFIPNEMISDIEVVSAVSKHFGITQNQLRSRSRHKMTVLSRQVAMYLLREETDLSLAAIGKILGGRDHSTVLYGHEKVSTLLKKDVEFKNTVLAIKDSLSTEN